MLTAISGAIYNAAEDSGEPAAAAIAAMWSGAGDIPCTS